MKDHDLISQKEMTRNKQCVSNALWSVFDSMDRLYWVDYQLDQIGHIGIQGYDRQTFTNLGQITQPYSLTVYTGGFSSLSITFFLQLCDLYLYDFIFLTSGLTQ